MNRQPALRVRPRESRPVAAAGMAVHRLGEITVQAPLGWSSAYRTRFVEPGEEDSPRVIEYARTPAPSRRSLEELTRAELVAASRRGEDVAIDRVGKVVVDGWPAYLVVARSSWLGATSSQRTVFVRTASFLHRFTVLAPLRAGESPLPILRRVLRSVRLAGEEPGREER